MKPSVVYVLPDKMGGMMNIVASLLAHGNRERFTRRVVLTHNRLGRDTRFPGVLDCDAVETVEYALPVENLYAVMRRVARAITPGPGVVVAGDLLDLATLSVHDVGRAVILILHGDSDYYYDLAVRHDRVVHAYVAYSRRMFEKLCELLPHRTDAIFHIPYGISLPAVVRQPVDGPLRLLFAGRLEHGQKGVLDLPAIDAAIRRCGLPVAWTVIGAGPDEERLREAWRASDHVRFLGLRSADEVMRLASSQDVFVLPTRHEGFPVALVEAMGAGLVPVVSAIDSGVPEIVRDGVTGFTPPVGDIDGFADAIVRLARDRDRLEAMSRRARAAVVEDFDIAKRVIGYDDLYGRFASLYRPLRADARLQYGSRLDRPWLPNDFVRLIRSVQRRSSVRAS